MLFIKTRDELCKNGEMLLTPALSYTERHLQAALEAEKKEKLPQEQREEEEKKRSGGETDEKGEEGKAVSGLRIFNEGLKLEIHIPDTDTTPTRRRHESAGIGHETPIYESI